MGNKILDGYVLRQFLKAFFLTLIGFLFIYIIINLFERIGYFIDRDAATLDIILYYMLFSPKIIVRIMPLAVLLGVYFSLGFLAKNNEMLAIRGLGISPFNVYRPIFIYGFIISAIVLSFNLSLVPRTRHLLEEYKRENIERVRGSRMNYARNINYITEEGWVIKIKRLRDDIINDINLFKYENGKIIQRVFAENGEWKDSLWLLSNVHSRTFNDKGIVEYQKNDKCGFDFLDINPSELAKSKFNPLDQSFSELLDYIWRLERSGQISQRERVELYDRISYPFMSFIILLFGCPLALEVKRRGLIFGFGLGILASFTFWGIIQLFRELGIKGAIPPFLSILTPDIIFIILGALLMFNEKIFG